MSHTQGEWNVVDVDRGYVVTALSGCYDVALVRDIGNQDNRANANLIASAPELLDALETLLNYDNLGAYDRANARQQARDAIAKATGAKS